MACRYAPIASSSLPCGRQGAQAGPHRLGQLPDRAGGEAAAQAGGRVLHGRGHMQQYLRTAPGRSTSPPGCPAPARTRGAAPPQRGTPPPPRPAAPARAAPRPARCVRRRRTAPAGGPPAGGQEKQQAMRRAGERKVEPASPPPQSSCTPLRRHSGADAAAPQAAGQPPARPAGTPAQPGRRTW